jgi:glutamate racemase
MTKPILFLDSGIGGLSVLRAVAQRLPDHPLVYCADSAGFPYGTKSESHVSARVAGLLGRLTERLDPAIVVIACNTASTIALGFVRPVLAVPVVGTVPAIKPAAERSKTRVIGVLGTDATVRQPYVDDLSAKFAADCTVLRHGSAALVEAAEAKLRGETPDPQIFHDAIAGLTAQPQGHRLDTIVLACTHFPLVAEELTAACPHPITFIDGAEGIARRVESLSRNAGEGDSQSERGEGTRPPTTAVPTPNRAIFTAGTESLAPLLPALRSFGLTLFESL